MNNRNRDEVRRADMTERDIGKGGRQTGTGREGTKDRDGVREERGGGKEDTAEVDGIDRQD